VEQYRTEVAKFVDSVGGYDVFVPGRYGWTVSIDSDGEVTGYKVEVHQPEGQFAEAFPLAHPLAPFMEWCRETAAEFGLRAIPSTASLRFRPSKVSSVVYVWFVHAPETTD
jgi:hypothetical protein